MAFCPATIPVDSIINPKDLILDPNLIKWSNPMNKNSHYYYQKLFFNKDNEKKFLVFETPQFYSKRGLVKSMNNSDQLCVQMTSAQRSTLNVVEDFMRTHARFTSDLEAIWKRQVLEKPDLKIHDKFRALYPSDSLFMKLHDEFEAFDSNYSLIDRSTLKQGYYRVLFLLSGFQYGQFSQDKHYLCALSMKVLQVVYEARKVGICYLNQTSLLPPEFIDGSETVDLVNAILNDTGGIASGDDAVAADVTTTPPSTPVITKVYSVGERGNNDEDDDDNNYSNGYVTKNRLIAKSVVEKKKKKSIKKPLAKLDVLPDYDSDDICDLDELQDMEAIKVPSSKRSSFKRPLPSDATTIIATSEIPKLKKMKTTSSSSSS